MRTYVHAYACELTSGDKEVAIEDNYITHMCDQMGCQELCMMPEWNLSLFTVITEEICEKNGWVTSDHMGLTISV